MDTYTLTGRRPDLEAIEVNRPEGYIGLRIFPMIPTAVKASKAYFKTLVADAAAETDRSAGAAPSATLIGDSSQDYSCGERIKRYSVPEDRVQQFGGIEKADLLGGKASKRSVMRGLETSQAEALLDVSANDVGTDFLAAVVAGKKAVKRYAGTLVLVCSDTAYNTICGLDQIKAAFVDRFGKIALGEAGDMSKINRSMLATVLGVAEVLVGDDDHWAHTTVTNSTVLSTRAAIVKLPSADEEAQDMDAILGKTYMYNVDDQPFTIDANANRDERRNDYDAQTWDSIELFNPAAAYVLAGIDATANAARIDGSGDVTLPASAGATNGDSIDLGAAVLVDAVKATITAPALTVTELPDAETVVYKIQESADDATFADLAGYGAVLTQTGAGGAGAAASVVNIGLPITTARYIRLVSTLSTSGGDCSGKDATLAARQ